MVKSILKFGGLIVATVNILGAIVTIITATINLFTHSENRLLGVIIIICGFALLIISASLYLCWFREHSRLRALRILAHRGRVNTINYMVYLDFLDHKFHDDYDNEPKANSLIITRSEFTFHFFNACENTKIIDVDYKHTFHIIKHQKKFDALILHAMGKMVRKMDMVEKSHTYIKYQNQYYSILPEPCTGDMWNLRNQVLDRVQCSLPAMKALEETLEFHYRINDEFNSEEDDIFVIYPKNYGKKFKKESTFKLTFDAPYFADIQLLTLPYDRVVSGPIQYVAQFENNQNGKEYTCRIPSLEDSNIYMIAIRHKVFQE